MKISVLYVALLYSSCTSFETVETEQTGDSFWVAEARENFQKSQKETEHGLAQLRDEAKKVNPYQQNETWALYRIEGRIYGVRTEAGTVTGELIADDASIVGPWVRTSGVIQTSGAQFQNRIALSKGYLDIQ